MKVKIVGRLTLVDDVSKFYELKKIGQCPLCNAGIQTSTDKRTLTAQCAPGCANNLSIPVPRVTTYDRRVEAARDDLHESTDKVLRAKFDFLFQYSKEKSLDDLKLAYLQARQHYNDVNSAYQSKIRPPDVRADLKTLREASGKPDKKREWCPRYLRFIETEMRLQHLKYKGAKDPLDMMPYTWAELEVVE
jgi:hypothetical protein